MTTPRRVGALRTWRRDGRRFLDCYPGPTHPLTAPPRVHVIHHCANVQRPYPCIIEVAAGSPASVELVLDLRLPCERVMVSSRVLVCRPTTTSCLATTRGTALCGRASCERASCGRALCGRTLCRRRSLRRRRSFAWSVDGAQWIPAVACAW